MYAPRISHPVGPSGSACPSFRVSRAWVRRGFRVQGSGFKVEVLGLRDEGSGFRVQGSGFRVKRVQGSGLRTSGFRAQGSGCRV